MPMSVTYTKINESQTNISKNIKRNKKTKIKNIA